MARSFTDNSSPEPSLPAPSVVLLTLGLADFDGFSFTPSKASRRELPSRTRDAVRVPSRTLGQMNWVGSTYRLVKPSAIIAPKLGTRCDPTPRKASPDWRLMADPARNAAAMIMGPR